MAVSPKRLQAEGKLEEALKYYVNEYTSALIRGDTFLTAFLMDEIAKTLILRFLEQNEAQPEREVLEHDIRQALEVIVSTPRAEELEEDIEIQMRKRFENEFEEFEEE